MRGRSSKRAIFSLKRLKYQYTIYQMKEVIFLYLLKSLNIRISVKVENGTSKSLFFYFYFLIVHISTNNVLFGLKVWVYVRNIRSEGTVSQILVLGLSFYFMQKNG